MRDLKQPAKYRLSAAERRAARIASLSTKQAELKQEAADRRAARASKAAAQAKLPESAAANHSDTPGK
jgi:hypothetical protein